jgi:uncharacterized membrane protein YqhA
VYQVVQLRYRDLFKQAEKMSWQNHRQTAQKTSQNLVNILCIILAVNLLKTLAIWSEVWYLILTGNQ